MEKQFIQLMLNNELERRLATRFPALKKDSLSQKEIEDAKKELQRMGFLKAMKDSNQDPKEIKEMILESFRTVIPIFEKRLQSMLDLVFNSDVTNQSN